MTTLDYLRFELARAEVKIGYADTSGLDIKDLECLKQLMAQEQAKVEITQEDAEALWQAMRANYAIESLTILNNFLKKH